MGDTPHKPLLKLRTFQSDQARARGETPVSQIPVPSVEKEEQVTKPVPKIIVTTTKKPESSAPEKTKPQPSVPTPPAFHELKKTASKKIEHIVAEASTPTVPKTVTVRKSQPAPTPSRSFSSEATVITSAKGTEFKLFPAILSSLKEWISGFGNKTTTRKYTVTAADRRKGVIQKATTNSGAIFVTDNDALKQEITKKRDILLAEAPHELHVNWSPKTEVGYTLLEEPHRVALPPKSTVTIAYKKRTLPTPEIIEPKEPSHTPKRVFVPPPPEDTLKDNGRWDSDREPVKNPPPIPKEPFPQVAAPLVFAVPTPPPQAPLPQPIPPTPQAAAPIFTPPPVFAVPTPPLDLRITKVGSSIPNKPNPKTSYLRSGLSQLFRFDTTAATVVLVGSLLSFVMVFLIVRTFLGIISPSVSLDTPVVTLGEPLTPAGSVIDVAISSVSYDALMSALTSESRPSSAVTEFRIIEANGSVVAGSQLWRLFDFSSDSNLTHSITEVRLGYAEGKPIIILDVTDALTVFGALLLWEPAMQRELASLLEIPAPSSNNFVDETVQGNDVRVLRSGKNDVLVYGFVDKNTVVITTSIEVYEATLSSN